MCDPTTIPIILCGKTEFVGEKVIEALKPEIEGESHPYRNFTQSLTIFSRPLHTSWRVRKGHHP